MMVTVVHYSQMLCASVIGPGTDNTTPGVRDFDDFDDFDGIDDFDDWDE